MEATVGQIMNREVATVTPTTSLREGVQKMNELGIGSLVVQSDGKPVGMVTERDILRLVENGRSPQDLTVRMIMSEPVEVIGENAGIQEASNLMVKRRIRRLPVVKEGELIGIITSTDIIRVTNQSLPRVSDLKDEKTSFSSPEGAAIAERPVMK